MTPSVTRKTGLGNWIRWILPALLTGGVVLALISGPDRSEREIAISATFVNRADNLLVIDAARHVVRLTVTGTPAALQAIEPREAICRLDLTGLGPGTHTIPVQAGNIDLPRGVALATLLTPSLTVHLETQSRKEVDVVAVLEGAPAPGFAVPVVNLTPNRIVLTGTTAALAGLDTVKTRPINLEGAAESFKKEIPLNLPETVSVDPLPRIVLAEVEIRERIITRRLEKIPVSARGAGGAYRIDPGVITLTITGPETIVKAIESDPAFAVSVDLKGLPPGTHTLRAAIQLPVRATLVHVTPEHFSVTITD